MKLQESGLLPLNHESDSVGGWTSMRSLDSHGHAFAAQSRPVEPLLETGALSVSVPGLQEYTSVTELHTGPATSRYLPLPVTASTTESKSHIAVVAVVGSLDPDTCCYSQMYAKCQVYVSC